MSFQTIESKKEGFKKYLESAGILDQTVRVLVQLYEEPEKPMDGIEYVKKNIGGPLNIDADKLKEEYDLLHDENQRLQIQVMNLKREIQILKPNEYNDQQ